MPTDYNSSRHVLFPLFQSPLGGRHHIPYQESRLGPRISAMGVASLAPTKDSQHTISFLLLNSLFHWPVDLIVFLVMLSLICFRGSFQAHRPVGEKTPPRQVLGTWLHLRDPHFNLPFSPSSLLCQLPENRRTGPHTLGFALRYC